MRLFGNDVTENTSLENSARGKGSLNARISLIGPVPESWGGPPRGGGVSTYVQGLTSALSDLGLDICLLGDNTNSTTLSDISQPRPGIRLYPMTRIKGFQAPNALGVLGPGRVMRMAWRLLRFQEINVPLGQNLRYSERAANYERFLQRERPQLLHVAHADFRQFLSQSIVRVSVPVVSSVLSATVLLRPTPEWLVQMTKNNYNQAAHLIACSNFVKEAIRPYVRNLDRLTVIPNGTDTRRFSPREKAEARATLGFPPNEKLVLYTGNLVLSKGVDVLLSAFALGMAKLADTRLVFVGAGREAHSLSRLSYELGIGEQVTITGYRPVEELPDWYGACDFFVLPSQSEGLSISLLEAIASGRPVVTTRPDIGEHDAVQDGVNGLLCPYGDVQALSLAMMHLAESQDMLRRMGEASRQTAVKLFDWAVVAQQVAQVYSRVLKEAGTPT